ncbi:hypothetical protein MCRY_19295 [Marivita cryptomonadis]|uniref:hypothetical protein n=1 Tax=Marivita cryptomonadis TaxID=505252 RepID=UPI000A1E00BD|nr:hypothetical protein [Marivita cryptomonadis]OSQ56653.1 hypothetical protein MCRY_19295 [Marivita cryptomonadis]
MNSNLPGVNFSEKYDKYAVYLPSLQKKYAQLACMPSQAVRGGKLPGNLTLNDLNYFNDQSALWHSKYALYSAGLFSSSHLSTADIVSTRDPKRTTVIGDSGGYQIAKFKFAGSKNWQNLKNDEFCRKWMQNSDLKAQYLRWLDVYCDYAMTLDMPIWATRDRKSALRKLSVDQLIDLSVHNLRYFEKNSGKDTGARAKYLNVLQDIGDDTGNAWYKAVTPFTFTRGWALGSDTKKDLTSVLYWLTKLLNDKLLDETEWIHILGTSSAEEAVYFTAIQNELRRVTGNAGLKISFDSSSPFRTAGEFRQLCQMPTLEDAIATWRIKTEGLVQNPKYVNATSRTYLLPDSNSPALQRVSIEEMMVEKDVMAQEYLDNFSEQLLANHNQYIYHKTFTDACDLVFDPKLGDQSRIPFEIAEGLLQIEQAFN